MRGPKTLQPYVLLSLLALLSLAGIANAQVTNWVAYNDHTPSAATHPNANVYSLRGVADNQPPNPLSGPLKDFLTGQITPAVISSVAGGTPDYFGAMSNPNPGNPAYNLFNGIIDIGNANSGIGLRQSASTTVTITFTNLDPSKKYVFRGTSVRGNNYADRWTVARIDGAVSFVNAHSANGTPAVAVAPYGTLLPNEAAWNSGENRTAGAVVGWDEIDPGPDGGFTIFQRQYADNPLPNGVAPNLGAYGYGFNAIMIAELGPPVPITITNQTTGPITVVQCRPFSLSVGVAGSFPRNFQWFHNGSPIGGANSATYSVPVASLTDAGVYTVEVSNNFSRATSNPVSVNVTPDTTPPLILGGSSVLATEIGIQFNELMDSNTTADAIGYVVNGGSPIVTNVVYRADGASVRLQLDGPVTSPFTVAVNDARDCAGNQIAAGTTVTGSQWANSGDVGSPALAGNAFSPAPGDVDIVAGGTDIWDVSDQFHFVYNQRSGDFDVKVKVQRVDTANAWSKGGLMARETLDGPSVTIEGYTTPNNPPGTRTYEAGRRPTTGAATLDWGGRPPSPLPNAWVRLRRNGDIWRAYWGTDGSTWTLYAGPATQPMAADLFVGAACTSHNAAQTTTAEFRTLSNVTYPGATIAISPQPTSQTVQQNQTVTFTSGANVTGAPANEVHYQWQRSDDGGVTWNNIAGANGTTYTITYPAGDDAGDRFRLIASIPGATVTSSAATLTLTPDTRRPRIRSVIGVTQTKMIIFFDEPMSPAAGDPFAYFIDQGITVADAVLNAGNPLRLDVDISTDTPMNLGTTYTLTAVANDQGGSFTGAIDTSGNPIDPNPTTATFVAQNYPGDPNTLQIIPTNTKRALGSLTTRGFKGRYSQVAAAAVNDLNVTEQMLAGTYLNPATGQPYPNIAPVPGFIETGIINYNNQGITTGQIPNDRQFPGYTGPADMYCFEVLTYVELHAGIYRMGVNSDDGFRVTPATSVSDPNNSMVLGFFNGGRGALDTTFDFIVQEDGLYPMRLIWEEGGGDSNVEWWTQSLVNQTYIPINDDRIPAFQPPTSTAPRITITRGPGANNVTLTWTDPSGTYQLQSSAYLDPPSWSNVSGVTVIGDNRSITIDTRLYPADFYRLRSP